MKLYSLAKRLSL